MSLQKRSPLKARSLRNPGESLEARLRDLLIDDVLQWYVIAAVAIAMAVVEWLRYLTDSPPNPWPFTVVAAAVGGYAVWRIVRALPVARSYRLGRDGEKAVGQFLEQLRKRGAKVFHDIPGPNFNIDHVIVHASGIYAIETKTISKPSGRDQKVIFDGDAVSVAGMALTRDPIAQVRGAASWLNGMLRASTGKSAFVKPVVLFPGWFVESTDSAKDADVWVLNPKAFPVWMANAPSRLEPSDVTLFAFHLGRFVRSEDA